MNTYEITFDDYIGYHYEDDTPEKTQVYQARSATQALRSFRATYPLYEINGIRRVEAKENPGKVET